MTPVVAVLGGSTPFTAGLVEALRAVASALPACALRLFGRDVEALERIRSYGERRLREPGWSVTAHLGLDEAVDGAAVVVNQIRFGGMEARAQDEALARDFGVPADETLGPCGLKGALRVVPQIRRLAAELGRRCPDAWVVNLSNPLSVATHAMIAAGAPAKCVGLCELPAVTVRETCRLLGIEPKDVAWSYAGLNHRGFIFSLKHRGEEIVHQLPDLLAGRTVFGVSAEEIRKVGALPLKYLRLSTAPAEVVSSPERAAFLNRLKTTLERELDQGLTPPPSLSKRDLSWYDAAVMPMLAAVLRDDGRVLVVNARAEDGLVREAPARVYRDRFEAVRSELPAHLSPWLERWTAHERAVLAAVESPNPETIEHALSLDPTVPASRVQELARALSAKGEG